MDQFNRFFTGRPTTTIAQDLLGHELVYHGPQGTISGLIVETEAYLGINDSASHAFGDRHTDYTRHCMETPATCTFIRSGGWSVATLLPNQLVNHRES